MSTQQAALENLRVIRSLMEKAHIYRAISAPAALVGGGLAVLGSFYGSIPKSPTMPASEFLTVWLSILAIASVLNVWLLAREAKKRGQPVFSEGMRAALRSLAPPLFAGGVLGIGLVVWTHFYSMAAIIWAIFYGLALLSTSSFSPRSLVRLGWLFLICGLCLFVFSASQGSSCLQPFDSDSASFAMGLTFGLLHIGYGIAVLFSKKPEPLPAE